MPNEQNIQGLPEGMRVKRLNRYFYAELEPAIPDSPATPASNALRNELLRLRDVVDPQDVESIDRVLAASPTEITDSQMPEIPCCPVHEGMLKAGTLTKPLNKCIVCRRNECEELRDLIRHGLQGWTSEDAAYADALVQEWAQEDERIDAAMKESQKP